MRLAVFFYADAAIVDEDITWLRHFLQAMVRNELHTLLIFTNNQNLLSLAHPRIQFPTWKVPTGPWARSRTLRRWQQAANADGAEKIICMGSQSFRSGSIPTFLWLQPSRSIAGKELRAAKDGAAGVWVMSTEAKDIMAKNGLRKVAVLRGGPLHGASAASFNTDAFKEQHTDGCEYFFYAGPMKETASIIGMLKAFSRFKHRQKSSWKLVLLPLGAAEETVSGLKKMLATYKYRQDVVLADAAEAQAGAAQFFAAAYTFVQPLPVDAYGVYLHDALAAALPVIATNLPMHKEVAGNAALYYEAGDEQLLATCLMEVYKDEALRSRLAEAARQAAALGGWEQTAVAAWQSLGGAEK